MEGDQPPRAVFAHFAGRKIALLHLVSPAKMSSALPSKYGLALPSQDDDLRPANCELSRSVYGMRPTSPRSLCGSCGVKDAMASFGLSSQDNHHFAMLGPRRPINSWPIIGGLGAVSFGVLRSEGGQSRHIDTASAYIVVWKVELASLRSHWLHEVFSQNIVTLRCAEAVWA